MSRFREELRVIPRVAYVIAALVYLAAVLCIVGFVLQQKPEPYSWPLVVKVIFTVLVPLPLTIYVLLIGYVYRDAKRRGMRHVMWTLLAALVPNAIGIILYFVLREPLLLPCPSCGAQTRPGFAFCPHCGAALARPCPACRRAVEAGWANCAYCGCKLTALSPHAA